MAETIAVEVAYAERDRQFLRAMRLPSGSTVAEAIASSGVERDFGIDVSALATGVWSKPVSRDATLEDGDRVELYRPLVADPKEARRRRASKPRDQP